MIAISDEDKIKLKRFARLKFEIKERTVELEELKPSVKDVLMSINAEDNPVATEDGKLTLRPRKDWTYSDDLEARILQVKADKKLEEGTGKATFTKGFDVYFK